ncbi:TetR/AcrR family transcriptional regulator [Cohnella sp. JJ-181]|uniref:TetR/AcrR family transcriptional regulator n=1 Tax=Cohnella rhizoplanae TaxID=2974897 RepID=UPI0022FF67F0|nr:TetR/AcrR family transcriptional regulator [Cohnella sp. JJ-181]CAI6021792.1 HTH-type transcriptional repressor ComR [Cohnella sp. JJ-181]
MSRTRDFDENVALERAMDVFWRKGYEAASLTDLTDAMNIRRPSLYAAFGDKRALFESALRLYIDRHAAAARAVLQRKGGVKEAVRAYFERVVADAYASSGNPGCFCVNTIVELAPREPIFELLTREHQLYLSELFRERLDRGIRTGELDAGLDAEACSKSLVVSVIGLTVMLKARPERSFADQTVEAVMSIFR